MQISSEKLFGMLSIGLLVACTFNPAFDVTVVNNSVEKLDNVIVQFDGFYGSYGIVSPREGQSFGATHGHHVGKWPKTVFVSWNIESRPIEKFSKNLEVPEIIVPGADQEVDLMIRFTSRGPEVVPRLYGPGMNEHHYREPLR